MRSEELARREAAYREAMARGDGEAAYRIARQVMPVDMPEDERRS